MFLISSSSYSQFIPEIKSLNQNYKTEKKDRADLNRISSKQSSIGFNGGVAAIDGKVGYAIGAFAEIKTGGIMFVPQMNYWNQEEQNNFEIDGIGRKYFGKKGAMPYVDGGLGVNFYNTYINSDVNLVKLSIILGAGIEFGKLGSSIVLLVDGKYKLIINDSYDLGNISCFIFTFGFKFPFK